MSTISVFDPAAAMWRDLTITLPYNWAYISTVAVGTDIFLCGGHMDRVCLVWKILSIEACLMWKILSRKACLVGDIMSRKACLVGKIMSKEACLVGDIRDRKVCLVGVIIRSKASLVGDIIRRKACLVEDLFLWGGRRGGHGMEGQEAVE